MSKIANQTTAFSTPWFSLVAKTLNEGDPNAPHYAIQTLDYVCVLAVTENQDVILVRQYRPAVEEYTLELPAGHVEKGETPLEAARRELIEETGYTAENIELMGCLVPDSGRLTNRMWCFLALDAKSSPELFEEETGVERVIYRLQNLLDDVVEGRFTHALHLAAILLPILKNKLVVSSK